VVGKMRGSKKIAATKLTQLFSRRHIALNKSSLDAQSNTPQLADSF
jgi:hypothetical protein